MRSESRRGRRTEVLVRYTRAHASERAAQEAAHLNLGAL